LNPGAEVIESGFDIRPIPWTDREVTLDTAVVEVGEVEGTTAVVEAVTFPEKVS
jgi:hypothetical protein